MSRNSLNHVLLRLTSLSLIGLGLALSSIVLAVFYFSISQLYQRQVDAWVESFPRSAISHLVDSDYIPLDSKVQLLQKTHIFKGFAVYDRSGDLISHFGPAPNSTSRPLHVIKDEAGAQWGAFSFTMDRSVYVRPFLFVAAVSLALTILATFAAHVFLRRKLQQEFDEFTTFIGKIEELATLVKTASSQHRTLNLPAIEDSNQRAEEAQINSVIQRLIETINEYQQTAAEVEMTKKRSQITAELAAQVAHDIRSPLAALEVAAADVLQIPEEKRILLRNAVARIRDIANSLLNKSGALDPRLNYGDDGEISTQLLSSLIESLVTEKRLQFRSRPRVLIDAWLDATSYGIFAKVNPVEFVRLLSNIINNSIEAFGMGPGTVRVDLRLSGEQALMTVKDDGKGIPPELLEKLGSRGLTHGKSGGRGLGLYHAYRSAQSWGGSLDIASSVGQGTTISLYLPLASPPNWFVSELAFRPGSVAVVLDDDMSIHQIWQNRLNAIVSVGQDIELIHTSTPTEIRGWVAANREKARHAVYLLDYELLGYKETGLSLAEELGIGHQAILVTSRYEEPAIMDSCVKLRAKLIPKRLAGLVPIRFTTRKSDSSPLDAVLIDDDPLTRTAWTIAASRSGKKLLAIATIGQFIDNAANIDRTTPIYIDSSLGEGVHGEFESVKLYQLGFGELYLTTGYSPEHFKELPHLRGIVGKDAPWTKRA